MLYRKSPSSLLFESPVTRIANLLTSVLVVALFFVSSACSAAQDEPGADQYSSQGEPAVKPDNVNNAKATSIEKAAHSPQESAPTQSKPNSSWLMSRGNLANTGQSNSATDALKGESYWEFSVASQVAVSPLYEDGILYLADTFSKVYAVDLNSKKRLWETKPRNAPADRDDGKKSAKQLDLANPLGKSTADQSFDFSVPVIAGDRIVAATRIGSLFAVDKKTGEILWERDLGAQVFSSLRYVNGKVLFGSLDKNFYAIDPADGSEVWRYECGDIIGATPAISRSGKIYLLAYDKSLHVIDSKTGKGKVVTRLGHASNSSIMMAEGCLFYTATGSKFCCFDLVNKKLHWSQNSVALTQHGLGYRKNRVFINLGRFLFCYQISDGAEIWKSELRNSSGHSPCLGKDLIYTIDKSGKVFAFKIETGKEVWSQSMRVGGQASPILVDGRLVVCDGQGKIHVFE